MPLIYVDDLPTHIVCALRATAGVIFTAGASESDRAMIDFSESAEGTRLFEEYLTHGGIVGYPRVLPTFGAPFAQFVSTFVQAEVWNLLATFEPLTDASFACGAAIPTLVSVEIPPAGGFKYNHSEISLQAVQDEIVSLTRFASACPALAAVPSGNVICDLCIEYATCKFMLRLRKF